MQNNIFVTITDTEYVSIPITKIQKDMNQTFLKYLKDKLEGKCNKNGLVKKDSIEVITTSCGVIEGTSILFNVTYKSEVCNPVENMIVKCYVKNITKAGIKAELIDYKNNNYSPIVIFIARDHSYDNIKFQELKEDDTIFVKIIGTRFVLNDEFICCIGLLDDNTSK
jgi:DNA-directed RNA polymerase subunit E'/Rpb7